MPTMKSKPDWLRASISSNAVGVDRKANGGLGILRGYVIAQAGPFKSDGRGEFDRDSLMEIVSLGNAEPHGLKSRFTHPDMSNDGAGKFLGRGHDLRMDKAVDARTRKTVDAVRGDLHFDKTAHDPPPEGGGTPLGIYVMNLAESDPNALSSSIVVQADLEYRIEKDGTEKTGDDGEPLPPLWRPTVLHASDIVDTGDAVDGLLSSRLDVERLPLSVLWKGGQMLDAIFEGQSREVIEERVKAYFDRYLDRKFGETKKIDRPNIDARRLAMDEMKLLVGKIREAG